MGGEGEEDPRPTGGPETGHWGQEHRWGEAKVEICQLAVSRKKKMVFIAHGVRTYSGRRRLFSRPLSFSFSWASEGAYTHAQPCFSRSHFVGSLLSAWRDSSICLLLQQPMLAGCIHGCGARALIVSRFPSAAAAWHLFFETELKMLRLHTDNRDRKERDEI